jgi:uncharacterized protein (UPF0548 family)
LATEPRARRELADLRYRELNFDLPSLEALPKDAAWHVDDYCRALPGEPPGPPIPGGSFSIAQRLLSDYEFADPAVVQALYDPAEPLKGRNMLLEIRFWMLRFRVGVRVEELYSETRELDKARVRVWGWAYRTLEGHLERGQMNYELWKWEETGNVEFRIHAISEMAAIRNPIVRLGFRLFGRREQIRFARVCGERMVRFTTEALEGSRADLRPTVVGGLAVSPSRA